MFDWFKKKKPFVPDLPQVSHDTREGILDSAWIIQTLKDKK